MAIEYQSMNYKYKEATLIWKVASTSKLLWPTKATKIFPHTLLLNQNFGLSLKIIVVYKAQLYKCARRFTCLSKEISNMRRKVD